MSYTMRAGSTGESVELFIQNASSTTGAGLTGLSYNSSGLTAYYTRTRGTATQITLAPLAAPNSAWSPGGFREIDPTYQPGWYRLDLPDAAVAAGARSLLVVVRGAANAVDSNMLFDLVAVDPQDASVGGMNGLATAAAVSALGSPAQVSEVFTSTERNQIRHRLGIDGTAAAPATGVPSLATAAAVAALGNPAQASTVGIPAQASAVTALGTPAQVSDVFTSAERNQIRHRLGIDGTAAAPATGVPSLATAAAVAALGNPAQENSLTALAGRFLGITSLASWLRAGLRKSATDATTAGEIGGSYDPATDSLEAIRDRGDAAWTTGGGGAGGDPLAAAVPGDYAPGTAGYRLGQIGSAAVTVTSPIALDGALTLVAGDDYSAADGRSIQITNSDGTWPDLTGATVVLTAIRNGTIILSFGGTIQSPTGSQLVTFSPSRDSLPTPADAAESWEYLYGVQATLSSGRRVTLQTGRLTLMRGH